MLSIPLLSTPLSTIDSINIELENTINIEDKIHINFELATLLSEHNTNESIKYIQSALSLAIEHNSYKNIALAHYKLYQILIMNEATEVAAERNVRKALDLCNQYKLEELEYTILKNLSDYYTDKQVYDKAIIYASALAQKLKIEDEEFVSQHLEIARLYNLNREFNRSSTHLYPLIFLLKQQKDYLNLYAAYKRICNNFIMHQNNLDLAKDAMRKAHHYAYLANNAQLISEGYYFLGNLYEHKNENKDTQVYYYQKAITLARDIPDKKVLIRLLTFIGLNYTFDQAELKLVKPIHDELKRINPFPQEFAKQFLLVDIYVSKNTHQYDNLLEKATQYLDQNNIDAERSSLFNINLLQYYINEKIRQVDTSSIAYFESYIGIKRDFIELMQNHFFELEEEYNKRQREATSHYQKLELENANLQKYIILFSCIVIALFILSFIVNISLQKKHDALNQKNNLLKLQKEINALELSMLNHQLDPNEIKNLIDSIAPEVQQYVPEAYEQITQLFNITHASLSNKISESLATQLAQVEDFIKLNAKTFSYPLSYEIDHKNIVNQQVELPRLLLKNIVENALKHGIKPKKAAGSIIIELKESNNTIFIKVIDNGVSNTLGLNEKSDSTGIGFTAYQKLFKLLNKQNKNKADLNIQFAPTGTTVNISIPIDYTYSIQNLSL